MFRATRLCERTSIMIAKLDDLKESVTVGKAMGAGAPPTPLGTSDAIVRATRAVGVPSLWTFEGLCRRMGGLVADLFSW